MMQAQVSEEVNKRLARATKDLEKKYAAGEGGQDSSVDGPTGEAYKKAAAQERKARKDKTKLDREAENDRLSESTNRIDNEEEEEGGDDDDYELRLLREARLKDIKKAQMEKVENIGKGHGQYREIVQDEFLKEVTSSTRVVCHFYHKDFPRCEIINHHIHKLVARHIETKFVRIDAEKTPFFVQKLAIRTIPSLIFFFDGVATGKIVGFEGLADSMPPGKEDEWPTIALARLLGASRIIDTDKIVDDDAVELSNAAKIEEMRMKAMRGINFDELDDDEDFSDLNLG